MDSFYRVFHHSVSDVLVPQKLIYVLLCIQWLSLARLIFMLQFMLLS